MERWMERWMEVSLAEGEPWGEWRDAWFWRLVFDCCVSRMVGGWMSILQVCCGSRSIRVFRVFREFHASAV
jgi:hypothetical protein